MKPGEMRRITVVGGGLMGHGIALEFALAGYDVRLADRSSDLVDRAAQTIRTSLALLESHQLVTADQSSGALSHIRLGTELSELAGDADLVIEAVTEDLEIKQDIFRELDHICSPHTILASNSSSYMPSKVATVTQRPAQVLVAHYFNPPYLLPLVELVRGPATSDATVQTVYDLLVSVGKKPTIVQREAPGFIGNRLQAALYREALSIVQEGIASPNDVDNVIKYGFGRRLAIAGEFEIFDLAGLDIVLPAFTEIMPDLYSDPTPPQLLRDTVEQGHLGVKTGQGFYSWTPESIAAARERIGRALIQMARWD